MSPAALGTVAAAGEGSLRDAESLLEQVVAYCGRTVPDEEVARALGLPEEKTLLGFCDDLLARRGAACLASLDRVAALGLDARVFAREVLGMLRHLAVLRAAPDAVDLVPTTPETLSELRRLAATASPGHLQSLFEIFLRVETEVRQATFPRMLLELAVLRAVGLEELEQIETLLARLEGLERRLAGGAAPAAAGQGVPGGTAVDAAAVPSPSGGAPSLAEAAPWEAYAEAPPRASAPSAAPTARAAEAREAVSPVPDAPAPPPRTTPGGGEFYGGLIERVRAAKGMLADFLEHGRLVQAGAGVLEIGFAPEDSFFLDTAREAENLACLRAAARELLGGRAEVRLTALDGEGGGPGTHEAPRETDRHRRLRHEALESEPLRWAVEILEAHVVEVKLDQ
jgi:DNA polymerase-3 subunit gamma/tau